MNGESVSPAQWATAIDKATPPTFGEVVRVLEESDVVGGDAQELVETAIAEGTLEETDEYRIRLAEAKPGDEEPETGGVNPTPEADKKGGNGGDKYREIYRDAADRAGRETWEFVEEEAVREALDAFGFKHLLDDGTLFQIRGWRWVDVSEDDEEPRRRWYYSNGDEPRPAEFRRFDELLREKAPEGYTPHYFRVARASKDPATQYGSWKDDDARLTAEEAVEWMKEGGNVGIAGRPDDPLINVDIDDDEATTPEDVPTSLRARSRSRTGWHTWYFDEEGEIPNIPTDEYGEVRTNWQYVVAPGSFVASTAEEIPDHADSPGYYTVEDEEPIATVGFDDLPQVFHDAVEEIRQAEEEAGETDEDGDNSTPTRTFNGSDSAVYDIKATDLLSSSHDASDRFSSVFHDSDTGANMSVSGDKLHCWRHNVAHGGLQALATLSDKVTDGCRAIGAPHKNSGAGTNRLKGDWRLVWAAWHEAKKRGLLEEDDPIPYKALRGVAVEDGLVESEELVERDSETGEVVDDSSDHDGETYLALPPGAYNQALEHVREKHGVDPGREPVGGNEAEDEDGEEYRRDPTKAEVVLEPKRAWEAARQVTPADLDDQPLKTEGDAWVDPRTGETVGDVVRAVAIDEFPNVEAETPLGERYSKAYRLARERFDAPLPEYLTHADAVARFDYVIGAVRELTFWHLDEGALTTEITGRGGDVSGEAEVTLDPTPVDGWRDSESGESVLVFPSGTVWDADLGEGGQVIDVLRFVAVDAGLLDDPTERLEGELFTEVYRVAREEYGAPLPRWNAGAPEETPVLPPAEELVDTPERVETAESRLEDLRNETEALYRDAAGESDTVDVLNVLPALGKTTAAIKTATDEPTTYLAPRKELMAQAEDKATQHGASSLHLPVFSEVNLEGESVDAGVAAVRDRGKRLLRDRWELLDAANVAEPGAIYDDEDEETAIDDEVELDRATCPTAEGEHGDAWAFAVHVARALDYTPRDVHERAEALFGTSLPCQGGETETCEYSHGWETVSDPDEPVDLLIGHYTHAHVESARTYYDRGRDGDVQKSARAVVLDEFPGRSFTETFGEDALDHDAVWLAGALTETVDDRQDLLERDVWDDDLVRTWLKGEAAEEGGPTHDLARRVGALRTAAEAAETATDILDGYEELLEEYDLDEPLSRVRDGVVDLSKGERAEIAGRIATAAGEVPPESSAFRILQWADEEVGTPLAESTDAEIRPDPDTLPAGELRSFVEEAVTAASDLADGAAGMLRAAEDALAGGDDGARELSVFAGDGYAHRKAHYLLEAAIRPPEDGDVPKIGTESFTFGTEDGTTLKHVKINDHVTVVLDRNGRGAEVLQPPARTAGGGDKVAVVGLDATARRKLWEVSVGGEVRLRDVHDSMQERAETLRDAHDLQVVQTSDLAKSYEGDPSGKNLDRDVALLEAIAEEYAGIHGPRNRNEDADVLGNPAVITTKVVRQVLEDDPRLDDAVAAWDNYGNLKGSNDLAEHRLAALLGSQHYGDAEIERFAALAGEEVERTGYGNELDYGSTVANTYLAHMREDQVMQAALRFARGESGAVVFAHTSALREDLPVVGRGQVIRSWSETATAIAEEWRRHPGEEFSVDDVAEAVDVSRRQVRRVLDEFATAGYLDKRERGEGRANRFTPGGRPGAGEVELGGGVDAPRAGGPGRDPLEVYYTANVRVAGRDRLLEAVERGGTTPVPAPNDLEAAQTAAGPPE